MTPEELLKQIVDQNISLNHMRGFGWHASVEVDLDTREGFVPKRRLYQASAPTLVEAVDRLLMKLNLQVRKEVA